MRKLIAGLVAAPLVALALPAGAGLWDDVKGAVEGAGDLVDDVKGTRDEAKDTVGDAKGLVKDTSEDVEGALPERGAAAPPPPPSAAPPPPPSARSWHVDEGGGQTRRVSEAELAQLIRAGRVGPDTHVYGGALAEWTAARDVPALKPYFSD